MRVENLEFTFDSTSAPLRYDESRHYQEVFKDASGGHKGVDIVAVDGAPALATAWLIEAKDFRVISNPPKRANVADLPLTVTGKVNDTLAGLADAAVNAADVSERSHAIAALAAPIKRVVLHLEPHTGSHTALFPVGFAASVLQRLRPHVLAIDANPLVLNIANTPSAGVPWTVA